LKLKFIWDLMLVIWNLNFLVLVIWDLILQLTLKSII